MRAAHPEGEPWVLVAQVLAEVAGVDPSRSFDGAAVAVAKTMRGVRHDWANRPCVTWSMAAELLASLKAEQARKREAIEVALIQQDAEFRASLPPGIPASAEVPGLTAIQAAMYADPVGREGRRVGVVEDALLDAGLTFRSFEGLVEHSSEGSS